MVVQYEKKFRKAAKGLDPKVKAALKERLRTFQKDRYHPLLHNHSLKSEWEGYRSINITGDWRAIYVKKDNNIVFIDLGTHSQLYR